LGSEDVPLVEPLPEEDEPEVVVPLDVLLGGGESLGCVVEFCGCGPIGSLIPSAFRP